MRIVVSKKSLEIPFRAAEIATASGGDITAYVMFRLKDGRVEILASNQRVTVLAPIAECTVDGEDKPFTVEANRLGHFISYMEEDEEVEITNLDDGDIRLKTPTASVELPSLDPAKFTTWDGVLAGAVETATVKADRLAKALSHVRNFILDTDTTRPEIAQAEVRDGVLWATDKKSMALVTVDALSGTGIRIFGKAIPFATKFLGLKADEDVAILEGPDPATYRQMFVRRGDGITMGVVRPPQEFPTFQVNPNEEPNTVWEIHTGEMMRAIGFISSAAELIDNPRLRFTFDDGKVVVSVKTVSGKTVATTIKAIEHAGTEALSADGFAVDYVYLKKVLALIQQKTLKFAIHKRDNGGFLRFRTNPPDSADDYLTVVVWRI